MSKIFTIAKWEFFEKVKRRSFLISIIIMPFLFIGLGILTSSFSDQSDKKQTMLVGLIDDASLSRHFYDRLISEKLPDGLPKYSLVNIDSEALKGNRFGLSPETMIKENLINIVLQIKSGASNELTAKIIHHPYVSKQRISELKTLLKEELFRLRLERSGVSDSLIIAAEKGILISSAGIKIDGLTNFENFTEIYFSAYLLAFALIVMVILSGGMFVRSMAFEKSSRLIEVILSASSFEELLGGKILGLLAVGFFQFIVWGSIGAILSAFGFYEIQEISFPFLQSLFFILGYVFYATLFVGLGSLTSTDYDAHQLTANISLFLILPLIFSFYFLTYPFSALSVALSYIPFTAPVAMIFRLTSTDIPAPEIILTILIQIISILIIIQTSAKFFRNGIILQNRFNISPFKRRK
ncbi:MAG: ABC transporter permease [Chlorobi bacterium]|nr:ABC transporter permease [Chlorobiota bacterium]